MSAKKYLKKATTVCLILDEPQLEMLRVIARRRTCSVSQLAREAIVAYLQLMGPLVAGRQLEG